jgi:hypothetical protein
MYQGRKRLDRREEEEEDARQYLERGICLDSSGIVSFETKVLKKGPPKTPVYLSFTR